MTRVHVIALGGTISMTSSGAGVTPTLGADELLAGGVETGEATEVTSETFRTVPSAYLTVHDVAEVVARAHEVIDDGADGVVVVQGTDTLEESSFVADLLHSGRDEPIVFTGAMRNPESPGADGPANLGASVVTAAADRARSQGALLCLNGEVHRARFVRKMHAFSPSAFASPSAGPAGWVIEGKLTLVSGAPGRPAGVAPSRVLDGRGDVLLHRTWMGDDGRVIDRTEDLGYAGVVIEAFGAGHVSTPLAEIAERLTARIPVVFATRTGAGSTLTSTYGFPGSERDLLARGLGAAGVLEGLKARSALEVALRSGHDRDEATAFVAAWGTLGQPG